MCSEINNSLKPRKIYTCSSLFDTLVVLKFLKIQCHEEIINKFNEMFKQMIFSISLDHTINRAMICTECLRAFLCLVGKKKSKKRIHTYIHKSVVMEIGLTKKWFHIVEDCVFHACFKYIFTILRITKFQRHNFGNEFLNTNSMRVRNNHWDFLPGVTCLQIDDYNFSSMEFSWQLNCVNFFCYDYQKHLCFKVIHQEFNCLNQTVIVKNDFFPCICCGC